MTMSPADAADFTRANSAAEVGRRARMLLKAQPVFAEEPSTLLQLAQSSQSDEDLLNNGSAALSQSSWQHEAEDMAKRTDSEQRGRFANLSPGQQQSLIAAGYEPPSTDVHSNHGGFLGSVAKMGGDVLKGAAHVMAEGPVIGEGLHLLNVVGDQGQHLLRMANDLNDGDQQDLMGFVKNNLRLASWGMPGGLVADVVKTGPRQFQQAWEETGNGARYYTDGARTEAKDVLGALPRDLQTPTVGGRTDDRVAIASDIVSGKAWDKIAERYGDPGTEGYIAAYNEITQLASTKEFQHATRVLDHGHVSMGRGAAAALGLTPDGKGHALYSAISGPTDLVYQFFSDPTLLLGEVTKPIEFARFGINALDHGGQVAELWAKSASVRRWTTTVAEHVNAGKIAQLGDAYPKMRPFIDVISDNQKRLTSSEAVRDWLGEKHALEALIRGDSATWRRGSKIMVPHMGLRDVVGGQVRTLASSTIEAGTELAAKSRRAERGIMGITTGGEAVPKASQRVTEAQAAKAWWRKGQRLVQSPITAPAQFLRGASLRVPESNTVELAGRAFPQSIKQVVDMGVFADVPRAARDELQNRILRESSIEGRKRVFKSVIHDLFSYFPEDDGMVALRNRFLHNTDMYFGPKELGQIPGMDGMWGVLAQADASAGIAMPSPREFMQQMEKSTLLRQTTGRLNDGVVDAVMSKAWKPSVLLRVGFIPRAAGEEMFNVFVRSPLTLPGGWAKQSAAAPTQESLAAQATQALGYDVSHHQLQRELDALGDTFMKKQRRTLSYDDFLTAVRQGGEETRTLRKLSYETEYKAHPLARAAPVRGDDVLRRYWEIQARAPQSLMKPFQAIAGITSGIARPVQAEYKAQVSRLMTEGGMVRREAEAAAKRHMAEVRRGPAFAFDPLINMAANLSKTAPGYSADAIDVMTRSMLFHATQGYRGMLRTLFSTDTVDRARLLLESDGFKQTFSKHISAASHGVIEDGRSDVIEIPQVMGDRTTSMLSVRPSGSEMVERHLRSTENWDDGMEPLAPHALNMDQRRIVSDEPGGLPASRVGARYFGPDSQNEFYNLPLPSELPGAEFLSAQAAFGEDPGTYIEMYLNALANTIESLPEQAQDAIRYALRSGKLSDMDQADIITRQALEYRGQKAGQQVMKEAGAAGRHDIENVYEDASDAAAAHTDQAFAHQQMMLALHRMSPKVQRTSEHLIGQRLETGELPHLLLNREALDEAQYQAVRAGLNDPQFAYWREQMVRNTIDSKTGAKVAEKVQPGMQRIWIPLAADKDAYKKAMEQGAVQYPEEMQGAARIGIGQYEHRRTVFEPNLESAQQTNMSFLNDWETQGHTWMPLAAYGTSDPDLASRISAQMNKQLDSMIFADEAEGGLIGYIDVPVEEANAAYARESARVARITERTKGEAQVVNYRVEPSHLATVTPEPLHVPSQYIDGQKVFGVPHSELINNWARTYVKRWQGAYMSPERDEVLSEMLVPQLLDHDYPLLSPTGERVYRASTEDILQAPANDLPASVFGPKYETATPEGRMSQFVRKGFNVIGESINELTRKPYFIQTALNAMRENERFALALRDQDLWGQAEVRSFPRYEINVRPDTPGWSELSPAAQAHLSQNRHVVGGIVVSNPSDDILDLIRKYEPTPGVKPYADFPGFVLPGTGPRLEPYGAGVVYDVPGMTAPVLSGYMDESLPGIRNLMEHLSEVAPTEKLQNEAAAIHDVLKNTYWAPSPGGELEGGSHWINHKPTVMQNEATHSVYTTIREGALHPIARATAEPRFNALMQARLMNDGSTRLFVEAGRKTFGAKLSPQEIIDHLRVDNDGIARFKSVLNDMAKADPSIHVEARFLQNTVRDTAHHAHEVADPESLVREWSKLPADLKDPKLPIDEFRADPRTPFWAQTLKPQDLPVLRAAEENAAAVNQHLQDLALDRAVHDVTPFIDNHHVRSQYQEYGRNVTPFWFAEEAFLRRWVKTVTEGPLALQGLANIRRGQLLIHGLRGAGIVRTDDQGNAVLIYPGTPAATWAASELFKHVFGKDVGVPVASLMTGQLQYAVSGNFTGFNIPSPSPLVSLPLTAVTQRFPEIAPLQEGLMGQQAGLAGGSATRAFIPASVRRFYEALSGDPESNGHLAGTMNDIILWRMAHGDVPDEGATPRELDKWLDEARNQARIILTMKAAVGFAAPAPPSSQLVNGDARSLMVNAGDSLKGSDLHPELQRLTQNLGYEDGVKRFLEMHPDATPHDAFNSNSAWLVGQSDRASRAPLPTTEKAADFFDKNQAWMKDFPQGSGWLLPPRKATDRQDQRAYFQQLQSEMRIRKAPDEFLKDIYVSEASGEYYDAQEAYFTARNQLKEDDTPGASTKMSALDEYWKTWKEIYEVQHPTFAASLTGGKEEFDRDAIVSQVKDALADPARPHIEQESQLKEVIDAYQQYASAIGQLSGDRRKKATDARDAINKYFANWLGDFATLNPDVEPFVRSIIRPLAERSGLPYGTVTLSA